MRNVFWIGIYPGLSEAMLNYMAQTILGYLSQARSTAS